MRSPRRPAGGWIADLVALGKCIFLCWHCEHKFNPKANGYEPYREPTGVRYGTSNCDGCRNTLVKARMFVKSPDRG